MIKSFSPRLVLGDTLYRTEGKERIPQPLNSTDLLFGYLCFLEFGSFCFCEETEVKHLNEKVYVNHNHIWKLVDSPYDIDKVEKVKLLKCLGKDVWDPHFFLLLKVEGEGFIEIVDLKEANKIKINKLMIQGIFEKCKKTEFTFQEKLWDDVFEIPRYDTILELLKLKKKEKESRKNKIASNPEQHKTDKPKSPPTITEEITTFTFLKGVKDIKLETIPPLKYRRLN